MSRTINVRKGQVPPAAEAGSAADVLAALRIQEDDRFVEPIWGDYVWLRGCYGSTGKRQGITECCLVSSPCDWHLEIQKAMDRGHFHRCSSAARN